MVPFGHFWAPFDLSKVPDCKSNFISLTYHYRYSFLPNSTVLKIHPDLYTFSQSKKTIQSKLSLTPIGADIFENNI